GQTADQVTQGCGNLVPDHVIHHREVAAHDHAEGEQEHVHYRVLEAHEEEQHDRHPHGDGLAADGGGDHGADHAQRHHPVAQHAAQEDGGPAGSTILGITQGAVLTDMGDALAHLTGLDGEAVGEDEGHHYRHGQRTGKVA